METQFWIQEQSLSGGYFDSLGLPLNTTEGEAIEQYKSWRKFVMSGPTLPKRNVRLVMKTTIKIEC